MHGEVYIADNKNRENMSIEVLIKLVLEIKN